MTTPTDGDGKLHALLKDSVVRMRELRARLDDVENAAHAPIAIVGMGCRFPGGATSPAAYWDALCAGREGVREIPATRFAQRPERALQRAGLLDDVDSFDAAFFGISPREAQELDPQQRLLLEVAWEALEDGGVAPSSLRGSRTGVFVGLSTHDYGQLLRDHDVNALDAYATTGNGAAFAAGRLSYVLGLEGPSLVVDTACSSSLVAVHLACASLRRGESDVALAGGVNLLLSSLTMQLVGRTQALSPTGRCSPFDVAADGFVRGEGCGVVVLKRLADAVRAGDRVWAVVRGSAVNQDGHSQGFTAPNPRAQAALLRSALADARIAAARVGYVETHGTGTPLGDPIELEALQEVLGAARDDDDRCWLGAVKANLGHLEAAAGVAGLIKAALVLHHGVVPRQLHFTALNPRATFTGTPFAIAHKLTSWSVRDTSRVAGVSAFGLSGTNAHVVLESAARAPVVTTSVALQEHDTTAQLLAFGAATAEAADALADRWRAFLSTTSAPWPAVCAAALAGRDAGVHRCAVVARSANEAAALLASARRHEGPAGVWRGTGTSTAASRVAFVCGGQGSLWAGLGAALLDVDPGVRTTLATVDAAFAAVAPGTRVLDALQAAASNAMLDDVVMAPRVLFAVHVALAAWWRARGIEPVAVIGHSQGEIGAAHIAGILTLHDAVRLTCIRSELLQAHALPHGAMLAVRLSPAEAERRIAHLQGRVVVGVVNAPMQVVLSGDADALRTVHDALVRDDVHVRVVPVRFASHSAHVAEAARRLVDACSDVKSVAGQLTFFSSVAGQRVPGTSLDGAYWARNLVQPVRFADAVRAAADAGYRAFVEVGGHPILVDAIDETLHAQHPDAVVVGSLSRTRGAAALLESAARLHVAGASLRAVSAPEAARVHVEGLPTYPWQRRRHWLPERTQPEPRATPITPALDDAFHAMRWRPAPLHGVARVLNGTVVVVEHAGGFGARLAQALADRGVRCVRMVVDAHAAERHEGDLHVVDARGVGAVLAGLRGGPMGAVVHVGATEARAPETLDDVNAARAVGTASITSLVRALTALDWQAPLWLVTQGAHDVTHDDTPGFLHAAVSAWGRVLAVEHPTLWGGVVDVGHGADVDDRDVRALVDELLAGPHDASSAAPVALRAGQRFTAELEALAVPDAPVPVLRDGVYVVTGGLSGVGLALARWLVARGARNLVLLSRSAEAPAHAPVLDELRAVGAVVQAVAVDVTDPAALAAVLRDVRATGRVLRGVVHAAGVLRDRPLVAADDDDVFAPKVRGAWLLHTLTRNDPLELFVLCSSLAALVGTPGQAEYAAANHTLDALAHRRRAHGLPALSVNWGLWDTGGMVDDVTRAQLEQRGLRALSAATACAALDRLVRARLPQAAVVDMDRARTSLSSSPPAPSAHTTAATQAFEQALAHAPLDAQPALWVEFLAAHAARILRMPRAELDVTRALTDLGLDSLMASELRRATHVAGTTLPLARLLKGASLLELAHDLCAQHTGTTSSPQVHVTSSPRTLTSSPWLVVPLPRPQASVQLVCFPYAGGGPPVFHPWAAALPAHIELHTVQLPARAARLDEAPLLRMEQLLPPLVDALAATIDRPFAFVGHCLGSLVMWEVAHALHARLGVLPAQFLVTGGRAPQCYSEAQVALDVQQFSPRPPHEAHTLPDALLLESLRDLGFATSEALFDDDDMRALMLPAVRADFALSNRYTCPARAPLDMPITAIGGRSDPYVTAAQLAGWAAHSTRPLQLEFRPGDHYFIATDRTHLVQRVTSLLAPWAARAERVEG